MKKNLLLSFLVLFLLSTSALAGLNDPKKESEKSAVTNPKENRLTDEEMSRMTRRADMDNLTKSNFSNSDKSASKNELKATKQVIVTRHHGEIWYGGGGLLLIILIVIILV